MTNLRSDVPSRSKHALAPSRVPCQFFLIDLRTFFVSSVHCFNTALFFRTSPFSSPVLTLTAKKGGARAANVKSLPNRFIANKSGLCSLFFSLKKHFSSGAGISYCLYGSSVFIVRETSISQNTKDEARLISTEASAR